MRVNRELIKVHKRLKISHWEWEAKWLDIDREEIKEEIHLNKASKYSIWRIEDKIFLEYKSSEEN